MSGIRKTDLDCRRQEKARAVVAKLHDARINGIDVIAGGKRGPYTVTVNRLNEPEMRKLVRMLAEGEWRL